MQAVVQPQEAGPDQDQGGDHAEEHPHLRILEQGELIPLGDPQIEDERQPADDHAGGGDGVDQRAVEMPDRSVGG